VTPPVAPGCGATCGTPAGEVQPLTSIDAAYTAMQGRWEFCDSAWQMSAGAPHDAIGIEFGPASRDLTASGSTVGGKLYYLVAGPSGPVRGSGFAYQLTYDISPEGTSYQINVHPTPNSGFWIRLRYSPCPTELEVWVFYALTPTTMVRFASCGGDDGGVDAAPSVPDDGGLVDGGTASGGTLSATCPATCSTPAGAVYTFSSVEEIYAAIAGRWQICSGTFPAAPADTIGVEYGPGSAEPTASGSTVGGLMYYLVQSAAGPVRGSGFAYQLTYDLSPEALGVWQLNMHPDPNSGFGSGAFLYSPCPREFELNNINDASPGGSVLLVPF
jgi:hypothetical protein